MGQALSSQINFSTAHTTHSANEGVTSQILFLARIKVFKLLRQEILSDRGLIKFAVKFKYSSDERAIMSEHAKPIYNL